ncbi:MAG: oxidoreductase, partial [Nitrospinota bacterium]
CPRLKVVHVLTKPGEDWAGESGRIDREKIERFCGGNLKGKAFYLCGPPELIEATLRNLKDLGVADDRIHLEIFSFLS